jgi:dihydrofolate synthase/folylpolyglutamate synthase
VSAAAFADRLRGTPAGSGVTHATVEDALAAARSTAQAGDRILVFGSFHTVAAAISVLGSEDG